MLSAVLASGGLDSMVLLADEAARGEVQPIYVSSGWRGNPPNATSSRGGWRTTPVTPGLWCLSPSTCGMCTRRRIGPYRGGRRRITRPTRTCTCRAGTSCLLGKAAVYCAVAGISRLLIGTLAHNPFPDATPASRRTGRCAVARPGPPSDHRRAVRGRGQSRGHPPRHRARRPVRTDPVVHESRGVRPRRPDHPSTLRRVQQVPRAPRCVRRSGHRRPHPIRGSSNIQLPTS
jgi:hypothetical protein